MILLVFAVYDSAVQAYMTPFFMQSRGQALRAFSDEVNKAGSAFNAHPGDFTLFHLGGFDQASGELLKEITPVSLGVAQTVRLVP